MAMRIKRNLLRQVPDEGMTMYTHTMKGRYPNRKRKNGTVVEFKVQREPIKNKPLSFRTKSKVHVKSRIKMVINGIFIPANTSLPLHFAQMERNELIVVRYGSMKITVDPIDFIIPKEGQLWIK